MDSRTFISDESAADAAKKIGMQARFSRLRPVTAISVMGASSTSFLNAGTKNLTVDRSRRRTILKQYTAKQKAKEAFKEFSFSKKKKEDENDVIDACAARRWLSLYSFADLKHSKVVCIVDSSSKDKVEHTPFSLACALGNLKMAKYFYEYGEEGHATWRNNLGMSPFDFACMNSHSEVVKWLYSIKAT